MNPLLPAHVQKNLVLASRSPRRRNILRGLEFDIDDIMEMETVGRIVEILESKGVG